jgi:hypothetical protein
MRALAWAPDERFATAEEMRVAIEDAMLETNLGATAADVAAFCGHHLAERFAARKQAVAQALQEADERSRVRRATPRPSSGPTGLLATPSRPSGEPGAETRTLGTAATMSSHVASPAPGRRRGVVAALSIALLAAGAAIAVLVAAGRHRNATLTTAAPASPETRFAMTAAAVPSVPPSSLEQAPAAAADAPKATASAADPATAPAPSASKRPTERRAPAAATPANTSRERAPAATANRRADYGF